MPLPAVAHLLKQLARDMAPAVTEATALVGIETGGVWVAEWLHKELAVKRPLGRMDVSFYRDDYHHRGLASGRKPSVIPFEVNGAHIILVDDVLYTGRTIRAALNELFDYGRPGQVDLAVLVDRGERELPLAANWCGHNLQVPRGQTIDLVRTTEGELRLEFAAEAPAAQQAQAT